MFSRRHPYLYFCLVFSGIAAVSVIFLTLVVFFGLRSLGFANLGKISGEKVGVIEIGGVIADSRRVVQDLKRFREAAAVKAIVLRIDSPGGGVGPSQEIYREVLKTVADKKVVASFGAVAASGGYYVAAASDGIMANPGTITGSIGVIMGFTNFKDLLHKIGLTPVVVKSGPYKDTGSPTREMTDGEKQLLQAVVGTIHRQFVGAIAKGRGMEVAAVEKIADGRIFSGEKALALNLVDRLGNLEDAIEWAGRMGGIKGPVTAVYARDKELSLLAFLTRSAVNLLIDSATRPAIEAAYLYRPDEP